MNRSTHTKSLLMAGSTLAFVVAITGCGGGGGGGGSKSSAPASSKAASSVAPSSTPASSIAPSSTPASSSSSSVNIMANVIRDQGGLFRYTANTGVIYRNALIGNDVESYQKYDGEAFVATEAGDASYAFVLTPDGWMRGEYENKVKSFNADGSVTTSNATAWDVGNTLNVESEIDIAGRNILELMEDYINTEDMLATINPSATFSSGAKAFIVNYANNDPIYSVYFGAPRDDGKCWWEGGDLASESGGNCMKVNMTVDANTLEKSVSGYEKLFSNDVDINTAGYRAVIIGEVGPNKLEMQVINNAQKTLKFYENAPNVNYTRLIATSTWHEATLPYLTSENKVLQVDIPEAVKLHLPNTTSLDFLQQDGFLRPASVSYPQSEGGEVADAVAFNLAANTDITTATTNYKNPLVGNWSAGTSDIFIFSNNNTFVHVKAESGDPDNCYVGSAIGTYSWNPDTTELNVNLGSDSTASEDAGSCSIGGESKIRLNGSNAIVFESEEGDEYPFTKQSNAGGLVGTWVQKSPEGSEVWVFTDTQYFLSGNYDPDGDNTYYYGVERGTYTFNEATGLMNVSVSQDTNDDAGFSHFSGGLVQLDMSDDGDSFIVGDGFVVKRLK